MGTLRPEPWQSQEGFSFRFEWGERGLAAVAPGCGAIVVVDVLRFTTAVAVAAEFGVAVAPSTDAALTQWSIGRTRRAARDHGSGPLELYSGNGARVAIAALEDGVPVFAGALRNATATANAASEAADGRPFAVVAAGELWSDGTFRAATEDLLGAGAVLAALDPGGSLTEPCCSPAARAARAAYLDAEPLLLDLLTATASGRQLWERGEGDDVRDAARLNISDTAARFAT